MTDTPEHQAAFGKIANPAKNCFSNYLDHFSFLKKSYNAKAERVVHAASYSEKLNHIYQGYRSSFNVFQRLRDGHDYFDEWVGLVIGPLLLSASCVGHLFRMLYELSLGLLMKLGWVQDDYKSHVGNAGYSLFMIAMSAMLAVGVLIKTALSVVTRPLITLFVGFKPRDVERFDTERLDSDDEADGINFAT